MDIIKKVAGYVVGFLVASAIIAFIKSGGKLGDFQPYKSDSGKFSVLMPGNPKIQTQELQTEKGPITLNMSLVESKKGMFGVSYSVLSNEMMASLDHTKMLDGAVNGAVENVNGSLQEQSDFNDYGCKGKEILIKAKDVKIRARIFMLDNRLYQLIVVGKEGSIIYTKADEFFKSFEYKKDI